MDLHILIAKLDPKMRLEIVSAADFLVKLLRLHQSADPLSELQLVRFKGSLMELLHHRYRDHWFPDRPYRGSGYRCIRINGNMDPIISQAGRSVGLVPALLRSCFPKELTMWIDPAEVSYRIGENGSICVLFEGTIQPSSVNAQSQPQTPVLARSPQPQSPPLSPPHSHSSSQSSVSSQSSMSPPPHHHQQSPPTVGNNFGMFDHHHLYQPQQLIQPIHHHQQHHHLHHHHQQQQQFESCKDSLLLEHTQFEKLAAYVSS